MADEVTAGFSRLDVKLGGKTLVADLEKSLSEIEVENRLHLPDTFTLRFHLSSLEENLFSTPDSDMKSCLDQGTAVIISEKDPDSDTTNVIMDGEVTSLSLEFSAVVPSGQLYAVV